MRTAVLAGVLMLSIGVAATSGSTAGPRGTVAVGGVGPQGLLDLIAADNSAVRRIRGTPPDWIWTAALSPTGKQVAFVAQRAGAEARPRIELMAPNGDGQHAFPGIPPSSFDPAWAPNGNRLAFLTSRSYPLSPDLFTIGLDGTGIKRIATNAASPSWSRDGREIVFAREVSSRANRIYVVAANGGTPQLITTTRPGTRTFFAADGRIAFTDVRGGVAGIFTVPRTGGTAKLLLRNAFGPAWSPEGTYLAVLRPVRCNPSGCQDRIYVTDAAAKTPLRAIGPEVASIVGPGLRLSWGPRPVPGS